MKVTLVWPSQEHIVSAPYMKKIQTGLGILPPLGLISVATWLQEVEQHSVTVIDACLEGLDCAQTVQRVVATAPDVVGISCLTYTWIDCLALAQALKAQLPTVTLVCGGPHCALFPLESLSHTAVDYVVSGEGEVPFAQLLQRLQQQRYDTEDLPGVMRRGDSLKERYYLESLEALPIASRRLTDYRRYRTVVSLRPPTTSVMSSRGCPYQCAFCYTAGGKSYRAFSAPRLLAELEACVDLGITEFLFFDELFTFERQRVLEFCALLQERGLPISWDVRARVNLVDQELLQAMARAGCSRVQYGIESGNDRILKLLHKGITTEMARQAILWTRQAGIATYADFMIGAPGETEAEILETIAFAKSLALDYVHFSILMLMPKTPFYQQALSQGLLTSDVWADFVRSPNEAFVPPYWNETLSNAKLEELLGYAMRSICFSPGFIWRRVKSLTSVSQLLRYCQAGLQVWSLNK